MEITYTFVSYLIFVSICLNVNGFELDIGQILSYSKKNELVNVHKVEEIENYYTHKFQDPVSLKHVYNKDKRLYLDPFLTNNQFLLSASVLWSVDGPLVVQLNLDRSSVILLNDDNSSLSVQAVFSNKTVTNLTPRVHSLSDQDVEVDLSKTEDYGNSSEKVNVSLIELSDQRFRRFTLYFHNFESLKLSKIKYNDSELKTVHKILEPDPPQSESTQESVLEIPHKDEVYGIYVYSYVDFPLLLEVFYNHNKRLFYGYTPESKWHRLLFPPITHPSYLDHLYKNLNYFACKNGFMYTIDVNLHTTTPNYAYNIDNYCVGPKGVETVINRVLLPFYTIQNYNQKYKCYEHIPEKKHKFFVEFLTRGNFILQLSDIPQVVDFIRVYQHSNLRPYLIAFVTPSKTLHYYKYEDKEWQKHEVITSTNLDERFNEDLKHLLDRLYSEDVSGKKIPELKIDSGATSFLKEKVRVLDLNNKDFVLKTVKFNESGIKLDKSDYDIWWYNSYDHYHRVTYDGDLNYNLRVVTTDVGALFKVNYYLYNIIELKNDIYVHRIDYSYDYSTYFMTVHFYTNALFVFSFKKNYYEDSSIPWRFISIKPLKVLQDFDTYKNYYEKMNKLNSFKFDVKEFTQNPLDLLPETLDISLFGSNVNIETIKSHHDHYNELKTTEFNFILNKFDSQYLEVFGDLGSFLMVKTKTKCGISSVKYGEQTLKDFKDTKILVVRITYRMISNELKTLNLYTNTLYNYEYGFDSSFSSHWYLKFKRSSFLKMTENLKKYFDLTEHLEDFNFENYVKKDSP